MRSVKNGIRKTIGKKCLLKTELETCLYEVAASINSRPLTFVGTDIQNKVPLTPNHFLAGQGNQGLESRVLEDPDNVSVESLCLRHQEMLQRQEDFWNVWSNEYVRNLPAAFQKFRKEGNLAIGSVVLIREDGLPRMKWTLGVVEKLHEGKDGVPRAAELRTARGLKTRAIQRLYNLEVADKGGSLDMDASQSVGSAIGRVQGASQSVDTVIDEVQDGCVDSGQEEANSSVCDDNGHSSMVSEVNVDRTSDRPMRRRKLPNKYEDFVMYQ